MKPNVLIPIVRMPGNDDLVLPEYHSDGSAGMDLKAAIQALTCIEPGKIAIIPAGFAMALPLGYEAQVRPRSGLATKHGVTVINSPGTIDWDYRGEVQIALINLGAEPFEVCRGLRIAQMVITPVSRAQWNEVQDLPATSRGSGAFGHTGI